MREAVPGGTPLELLGRERSPDLVDQARRVAFERFGRAVEMLCPEPQPRLAGEYWVVADDVHLRIIEEGVLVQVRGSYCQPAVVDDADLGVYVHAVGGLAAHRVA